MMTDTTRPPRVNSRTWAPERIQQMCDLIAKGQSFTDVAEAMGVSRSAVSGQVDRMRIRRDPRLPTAEVSKAPERRRMRVDCPSDFAERVVGKNNPELCRIYGVCDRLISRWRLETNTVAYVRGEKPPENFAHLAPTMSLYQAQQFFERGAMVVKRWAMETGVRFRQPVSVVTRGNSGHSIRETQRDMSHVGQAAEYLRRFGFVYRCDKVGRPNPKGALWRRGSFILTDAEIVERAERQGWDPHAWKRVA